MHLQLLLQVRLQEYLELVKAGQRLAAVKHAKKFLSLECDLEHSAVVQQAMGLLAFPTTTSIQPYKDLMDPGRWEGLITQFRAENFRLHQLSSQSMFTVALQSGLAALKTPQGSHQSREEKNELKFLFHGMEFRSEMQRYMAFSVGVNSRLLKKKCY